MSTINDVTGMTNIVHCSSDTLQIFMALITNQSPTFQQNTDIFTFERVTEYRHIGHYMFVT